MATTEPKDEGPGCMTIGELRAAIKDLSDDMPVILEIAPEDGEEGTVAYADNGEVEEEEAEDGQPGRKCFFITGYSDPE